MHIGSEGVFGRGVGEADAGSFSLLLTVSAGKVANDLALGTTWDSF